MCGCADVPLLAFGLPPVAQAEQVMNRPLHRIRPEAYEGGRSSAWAYIMLSREQSRLILGRIVECERPLKTLLVWEAVRSYAEWNTGQINVPTQTLADAAHTTTNEVSRALSCLVELGALIRTGRGRYALNPEVAWSGSLVGREQAASELTPAE